MDGFTLDENIPPAKMKKIKKSRKDEKNWRLNQRSFINRKAL